MARTSLSGPIVTFGQAPYADYNPALGASSFWAGGGTLDPRSQFTYIPGQRAGQGWYLWQGTHKIRALAAPPVTKSATLLFNAAHIVANTAVALPTTTTTGLAVGVTVPRQDTNVNVTGLVELDPLVATMTASLTSGSNIINVTATGTGSGYNTNGICPGMVLTDSTTAANIPTGTYITGFVSGGGGTGTYTMSANATATATGDTVTGLYTAFPHAIGFGSDADVRIWNANAMISRALIITASSASAPTTVWTINGLDVYGFPMTEQITVTPGTATTTNGVKAWKYILSATPNQTDATYNWSVGTTDIIGFPIRSDNFQPGTEWDVALEMNNAAITATTGYTAAVKTTATATTGDVRGTYTLQTNSNGTLVYAISSTPMIANMNSAVGLYGVTQYTAW